MLSIFPISRPARVGTSLTRRHAAEFQVAHARRTMAWLLTSAVAVIGLSAAMVSAQAQTSTPGAKAPITSASALTPVGNWKTIDDTTHEPRALIRIYTEADGSLSGEIQKVLDADANPDKRCDKCTDDRKDHLIQGLRIIEKMHADGETWDQGTILDPESGKIYRAKMTLADNGQKLIVRGYIGISLIGRSQTWIRDNAPAH